MRDIPHAVLSDHLHRSLRGRRLTAALFLTYKFEPGFFEQEILPVFLDLPMSHAAKLRLVQLEDALRSVRDGIAVYYDADEGLQGESPAHLDVRRIPVRYSSGKFHPKNVFFLSEPDSTDREASEGPCLHVATLSANLTRAGWWENIEVCHVEEICQGSRTRLRDPLLKLLRTLLRLTRHQEPPPALVAIQRFLRSEVDRAANRSHGGRLYPHFYPGDVPLAEFLENVIGTTLRGWNLEIVSPYFDHSGEAETLPLHALIDRFEPREVRVFLPRANDGAALCAEPVFRSMEALPEVRFGALPGELLRSGKSREASDRTVHAKVYRFFSPPEEREILLVGSPNLTRAAHGSRGNFETAILVEPELSGSPDFWLSVDDTKPAKFLSQEEEGVTQRGGHCRLALRYHWDQGAAFAYWDHVHPSPPLDVDAKGVPVFRLVPLPARTWHLLPGDQARLLQEILKSTSFVTVRREGGEPTLILVQEEGMSHKPSLLLDLTVAEILRFWSLLKPEQRQAFIEARGVELAISEVSEAHVPVASVPLQAPSVFDRFAGFFHAFRCLKEAVDAALADGRKEEARCRLFGKKYDSLRYLLERVGMASRDDLDDVERYIIYSCARELCHEVASRHPAFWQEYPADTSSLYELCETVANTRERLLAAESDLGDFLTWFDKWFPARVERLEGGEN